MEHRDVIWLPTVRGKLLLFKSEYFTPEETFDFIVTFIIDTEEILKNKIIDKTYTEEFGIYKGLSRIVIRKFRIYYEKTSNNIIILAILFPGED